MNEVVVSSVDLRENESMNHVIKFNQIIIALIDRMQTSQSHLKWALTFTLYGLTQVTFSSFFLLLCSLYAVFLLELLCHMSYVIY